MAIRSPRIRRCVRENRRSCLRPTSYNSLVLGAGGFWYGVGVGWVMGREGVSDEMGGVTNGQVLAFDGIEVELPIFGLADV